MNLDTLPVLSLADFESLLPVTLVAALLSFSDTMIVARAFALRSGEKIDSDQELIASIVGDEPRGQRANPVSRIESGHHRDLFSGRRRPVADAAGAGGIPALDPRRWGVSWSGRRVS